MLFTRSLPPHSTFACCGLLTTPIWECSKAPLYNVVEWKWKQVTAEHFCDFPLCFYIVYTLCVYVLFPILVYIFMYFLISTEAGGEHRRHSF